MEQKDPETQKLLEAIADLHIYLHEKGYNGNECLAILTHGLSNIISLGSSFNEDQIKTFFAHITDKIISESKSIKKLREQSVS